jgi:hypothetical protein
MKNALVCAMAAAIGCWCSPNIQAQALPQELRPALPVVALSGRAAFKFWGFDVYQATLWVAPGFDGSVYEQGTFALELSYQRDFKGADIASRSIAEMQRQGPMTPAQQTDWESRMRALFPDVKAGDRITGVHQPAIGAAFWCNGRWLGEVRDPVFSRRFFGIWLSPQTSEPQLRSALLAREKLPTPRSVAP